MKSEKKRAEASPQSEEEALKIKPEETAAEKEEPIKEDPLKALKEKEEELEKLKSSCEDYKRKWYLVTAEYENYRKRTQKEAASRYLEGRADVLKGLFPIADNLERALKSCEGEGTRKGIEMVLSSFEALLKEEKISSIDPEGEPFDAERHEAIMAIEPEEGEESGIVKQVYQKGYERDGKVLRYAQVVVTK